MPLKLDALDVALLESLIKDGRKSFNEIAREIKTSAPTVKTRYDRLVNIGLIRAVTLDVDFGKLETETGKKLEHLKEKTVNEEHGRKLGKNVTIPISCDYCKGSVDGKPHVLKFASFERFFCCTSCRSLYKEKYKTRMDRLRDI